MISVVYTSGSWFKLNNARNTHVQKVNCVICVCVFQCHYFEIVCINSIPVVIGKVSTYFSSSKTRRRKGRCKLSHLQM